VAAKDIVRKLPVDLETLQVMNPAFREPVFDGRKHIPPGQTLYLPKHISPDLLDKTLGPLYQTAQRPTPLSPGGQGRYRQQHCQGLPGPP